MGKNRRRRHWRPVHVPTEWAADAADANDESVEQEKREARKALTDAELAASVRVFVANLPFKATKAEIERAFVQFGPVKSVNFVSLRQLKPGNWNAGKAVLEFESRDALERCLAAPKSVLVLRGRPMNVREDPPARGKPLDRQTGVVRSDVVGLSLGFWDGTNTGSFTSFWSRRSNGSPNIELLVQPLPRILRLEFDTSYHPAQSTLNAGGILGSFSVSSLFPSERDRIDIKFNSIVSHAHLSFADGITRLTFQLNHPPYSYRDQVDLLKASDISWNRLCDFTAGACVAGRANAVQIQLVGTPGSGTSSKKILDLFARIHVRPAGTRALVTDPPLPFVNAEGTASPIPNPRWTAADLAQLSFPSLYALDRLSTNVFGYAQDPIAPILSTVRSLAANQPDAKAVLGITLTRLTDAFVTHSALRLLQPVLSDSIRAQFAEDLELHDFLAPPAFSPSNVRIRRISITPTRIICGPSNWEPVNRAVRIIAAEARLGVEEAADYFLRVSFVDENLGRNFQRDDAYGLDDLYNRVRQVLSGGFSIGGRKFEFLAWSVAMLKEHSVWFFAPVAGKDAEWLRRRLGSFEHIKIPAKYAARLSQCFSAAVPTSPVHSFRRQIPDIVLNGYTFSDGVGTISTSLADKVYAQFLKLTKSKDLGRPSAFQIRLGGVKGVVSVDSRLTGDAVCTRPSMEKFEAADATIEVVRPARSGPAFLNRQLITVLSSRNVPDESFEDMQNRILDRIDEILSNREVARAFLFSGCMGVQGGIGTDDLVDLLDSGFGVDEPFLRTLFAAIKTSHLRELREKARVFVPDGVMLMGIMDETGTLGEDEVFLVCESANRAQRWKTGRLAPTLAPPWEAKQATEVAVTRFPCLHPGDVRNLKAISLEVLAARNLGAGIENYFRNLKNVIVFPSKGKRPHTDKCGGGDLDGDIYQIMWTPSLLPPSDFDPMEYTKRVATATTDAVTITDIQEFFINFCKSDTLGTIANLHLAIADMSRDGAKDVRCIKLAELHSDSVDFEKTGVPANLAAFQRSRADVRPTAYPDFMEKDDMPSYESQKVLGRMYRRAVEAAQRPSASSPAVLRKDQTVEMDRSLLIPGRQSFFEEALRLSWEYEHDLISLLSKFGIPPRAESELISGHIQRFGAAVYRKKKRFDAQESAARDVGALRGEYRRRFREIVLWNAWTGDEEDEEVYVDPVAWDGRLDDLLEGYTGLIARQLVSAIYEVTYETEESVLQQLGPRADEIEQERAEGGFKWTKWKLLSLPWMFPEVLARIKGESWLRE